MNIHECVLQGGVTENQREMITANWGKLNLSRQQVVKAKQAMVAALDAAFQEKGSNMLHLSSRAASTSLAAEQVKAALLVRQHAAQTLLSNC